MKKVVISAAAFALSTVVSVSQGWATCALSDMTDKTWMVTATEITNGVLFYCKLSVNGSGAIASLANGCSDYYPGQKNFSTPSKYNVKSGTVKLVSANDCMFDINVVFGSGSPSAVSRVVLDYGKNVATGNFVVSWGGGGSWNVVRIK